MANRNWNRFQALEKECKSLYLEVAIGSSGAPTISSGVGIASISRTSAGLYRIVLQDKYVSLKDFACIHLVSAAEDLNFQVKAEAVSGASPYIDFFCLTAGSATDPSDGAVLKIKIDVKNSSAI